MGRLVRKPQAAEIDLAGRAETRPMPGPDQPIANAESGDGYLERMVKYVPAEIIAFSMLVNAILDQAMKSGGRDAAMAGIPVPIVAAAALVIACVLTPVYCWYVRRDGDAWVLNAAVSTIALPFWMYLMGAVAFANHHDGNLAAILVMSFTVISGLVAPKTQKALVVEQTLAETPMRETPRLVNALAG